MKYVDGYWVPDREERLDQLLKESVALGRPAYQHHKLEAALAQMPFSRRTAIDIGSHIGMWTMQLLHAGFRHVHAFDPDQEKSECFLKNLEAHTPELAGLPAKSGFENVTRYAFGLGAEEQTISLIHKAGSSLKTHVKLDPAGTLRIVPLDSIWYTGDIVDFIKIDVEGYEYYVVKGAEKLIKRDAPVIVVEQKKDVATKRYGIGDQDALRLLESWGYTIHAEFNGDFVIIPSAS